MHSIHIWPPYINCQMWYMYTKYIIMVPFLFVPHDYITCGPHANLVQTEKIICPACNILFWLCRHMMCMCNTVNWTVLTQFTSPVCPRNRFIASLAAQTHIPSVYSRVRVWAARLIYCLLSDQWRSQKFFKGRHRSKSWVDMLMAAIKYKVALKATEYHNSCSISILHSRQ